MPEMMVPIFPDDVVELNPNLAVGKADGRVTYCHAMMPVFTHGENDIRSLQMITSR